MTKRLFHFICASLAVVCAILFPTGCARAFEPKTARILLHVDDQNHLVAKPRTVKIGDESQVRKLASYFPDLAKGKRSHIGGKWENLVTIEFTGADGKLITIYSNFEMWNDRKTGDFPVKQGLEEYIKTLFQASEKESE